MELAESKVVHRKAANMSRIARLVGLDAAYPRLPLHSCGADAKAMHSLDLGQDSELHQFAVTERREQPCLEGH
jgi:hypothetical protein